MASNGLYDENLLAEAPVATKYELQEGYNIDILKPKTRPHPATRTPVLPPDPSSHGHQAEFVPPVEKNYVVYTPLPFWRTTKGRIIIAVAFVLVIIVAVGAGVGVSKSKKKHINSSTNSTNNPFTSSSTSGGVVTNPSGSAMSSKGVTKPSVTTPATSPTVIPIGSTASVVGSPPTAAAGD